MTDFHVIGALILYLALISWASTLSRLLTTPTTIWITPLLRIESATSKQVLSVGPSPRVIPLSINNFIFKEFIRNLTVARPPRRQRAHTLKCKKFSLSSPSSSSSTTGTDTL
ncbi:hypothetical protein QR685DRAFT_174536 [Neurospora intermedia]|uniref:Secreted protein n=1 Tax=Neurospora intermedia TaxID=5142 RepID=A0ABR3DL84_NEUIN